jgi:hypothetical protein
VAWSPPELDAGESPGAHTDPPPATDPAYWRDTAPTPVPPSDDAREGARAAPFVLLSLLVSLFGFLVVAYVLYEFKFDAAGVTVDGLPTRVVFVGGILLAVAPFLVTVFHRVPITFLIPPVLLVVFLYPLFSPFGLPYDRDSVYVVQFAQQVLTSGAWVPAHGVQQQGIVYSYYPGVAVFLAEVASLTSLPLFTTFPWSIDAFRLLVIPPAIYALAARLFGSKVAPLAVLLYLVEPSIEMNVPTQQDFAVTFFVLAITTIGFLAVSGPWATGALRVAVVTATTLVIVSHHVSTYLLLGLLGALALLPRILWREDPYPSARTLPTFLRSVAFAVLWAALVSFPVLVLQWTILGQNLSALVGPSAASTAIPGASFPLYQTVWVFVGVAIVGAIAILTLLEARRRADRSFVTMALLSVLLLAIVSIPFLSTGFSFLALREFEFTGVILAPVSAWWIITRLVGRRDPSSPEAPPPPPPRRGARARDRPPPNPLARGAVALAVVAVLVTGGSLVPLSTRDQFSPLQDDLIDSPMFITPASYAAVQWAESNLSRAHSMWGDMLTYTVFGGFGGFHVAWDSYELFNGTGFAHDAVFRLAVGSYVVVDPQMLMYFAPPMFPGTAQYQPTAALTESELAKFQNPSYFSPVFSNSAFTIYVTTAIPPSN